MSYFIYSEQINKNFNSVMISSLEWTKKNFPFTKGQERMDILNIMNIISKRYISVNDVNRLYKISILSQNGVFFTFVRKFMKLLIDPNLGVLVHDLTRITYTDVFGIIECHIN